MISLLLLLASTSQAADWVSIQGLEPSDPDAAQLRPIGFIQVLGEGIVARPVTGLESPALQAFEGERALFNTVGNRGQSAAFTLRRVRLGARGDIPGTDGRFSTFVAVEFGQNAVTTINNEWRPSLMDASITWKTGTPVNLRVGQFKSPTMDEALEAVHLSADLIQFSVVLRRLVMERAVLDGAFVGRATGMRDVGVQAFGSHATDNVELSWAAVVSNGSVRFGDVDAGKDVTGRAKVSWLLDDKPRRSPARDELSGWAWGQTGGRAKADGELMQRTRAGGGAQLNLNDLRLRAEVVWASGVLNAGFAPPFVGGGLVLSEHGQAWGATGLATYRFGKAEFGIAYAHLDSLPGDGPARRTFDELTGIAQWHWAPPAWVNANVGLRSGGAPEGSDDAKRILQTMGPYLGLELTVVAGKRKPNRSGSTPPASEGVPTGDDVGD